MATPTDPDEVDRLLALSRAEPEVLEQLEAAVGRLRAAREAKATLAGLDPATLRGVLARCRRRNLGSEPS